jgi:hypothetical protein
MSMLEQIPTSSTLIKLYASIAVDDRRLFLAQSEIRSLEPVAELNCEEPPTAGVGWTAFGTREWPVYCLGSDLRPMDRLPSTSRICVLLGVDEGYFGLLCDELDLLSGKRLQTFPLPAIMRSAHTPVQALVLHEDTPGCVLSADRLLSFLDFWVERCVQPTNAVELSATHRGLIDA